MSNEIISEVTCPICMDILKPPIRMLLCGHNLCEVCLLELCKMCHPIKRKCPICRERIHLSNGCIYNIPRNRTVEALIKDYKLVDEEANTENKQVQQSRPDVTSDYEIEQIKDLATAYIQSQHFKEAIELLQEVKSTKKGSDKIKPMLDIVLCLFKTFRFTEARKTCGDIAELLSDQECTQF